MTTKLANLQLYRWRYAIGYVFLTLAGLALLAVALFYVPAGLTHAETQSVVATAALSFHSLSPDSVINAPYHVLQWLSIRTLRLTPISVKLPSAIIAILTIIGVVGLLRYWFRRNVAILTSIIVVTTGQFLFLAQNGTPEIMPIFWAVWILFSALMVSRAARFATFWKIMLFGTAALSLYTPLSIYMLVAVVSAGLLHPHLRYLIRQMSTLKVAIAIIFAVAIITPLGYAISLDHSILLKLVGWPHLPIVWQNTATTLYNEYVNFMTSTHVPILTPIYGLGYVLLAVLGIIRFATAKYTARGYILVAWIILLIIVVAFNPRDVAVTFVPVMLLVATGIDSLFRRWYSLFPRNPYARVAGLVPLAVLLGGMIASGLIRYINTYTYDPIKVEQFSPDLHLVNHELQHTASLTLVVRPDSAAFYDVLAKYNPHVQVTETMAPPNSHQPELVERGVQNHPSPDGLSRIVTDSMSHNADRFYLYQK
ncbi:MAG TPA: hypothetical protein VFQ70_00035 [Candidatus Saccharimonadaceae bacterium]|nr:hypothetical protein [Candidatus Saccharimonadaceae bacterium]